jgi:hypothetical protein
MAKIVLDMSGEQGNAFFIMGVVRGYLTRVGKRELQQEYFDKITSSNYDTLLDVSQKYCPEIVYKNRV